MPPDGGEVSCGCEIHGTIESHFRAEVSVGMGGPLATAQS